MKMRALGWWALALALHAGGADAPLRQLTPVERLHPEHLAATRAARQRFEQERRPLPNHGVYEDFRAVIHVHAEDSNHTKGTRPEVLAAAKKTGVRIALFTDHRGPKPETWHELRDEVLFLAGSEDDTRVLRFPSFDERRQPQAEGELRFLSHLEERLDASSEGFVGMEICNRHTDAILDRSLERHLEETARQAEPWRRLVENFRAYPDEVFAAGCDYRAEIFAKWDRETQERPFVGIGANDAHQNQVFQGTTFDPYEVSFRNLCTHILARELTEPEIRQALRRGHAYVSHDWLCDPTGFAFAAVNNLGVFPMGDTAPLLGTTRLVALTPLPAKLKLIHHGKVVSQTNGTNLTFRAKEAGAYRLEAWLDVAGEDRPWVYSNPVYLKPPGLAELQLPSTEVSTNVEIRKDIAYTNGRPEDDGKHKLDVYLPKGRRLAPVFLFIHGGAWRSGDRSQYLPLGNRFAREGILTVIPSYRLAPQNPHPAQIEDVAAAFAWMTRQIGEWGGDTNRMHVGGHSAGGHLAALLALDAKHLHAHGLSPKTIRAVLGLSGVFNLTTGDSQSPVFGKDAPVRRDASPLYHVTPGAPPFLLTYCEWDYASLPGQAREFHAALREAAVEARLVFIPGQSHISEMLTITRDDDLTARTVIDFIQR